MFHTQPVKWEVVDSFSVDPIRIYVEDEGATIVRLASNEIVGNYIFDMDAQARPSPPQRSPGRRRGSNSSSKRSNEPIPTRRRSLPQSTPPPGGIRSILRDHNSDSHGVTTNSTTPLNQEGSPNRTNSPEPITPPPSLHLGPQDTVSSSSKHSSVLSSALSLFKSHRRSGSTSSGSNSDSGSGSGSSDGDSDSSAKSTKSSDFFHRRSTFSRPQEAAPLHRPYDKVDLKKALIFARGEILKQVEASGKNALVLEGWNITVLCRGHQYRLQIEYTARPAIVLYEDKPRTRRPPYLQILDS
ncbi:hypothetical protein FRC17_004058 [Serendipita sp. 399]|nr:hypothetical protein FRC17_004058 [Serendipita sp. 399]